MSDYIKLLAILLAATCLPGVLIGAIVFFFKTKIKNIRLIASMALTFIFLLLILVFWLTTQDYWILLVGSLYSVGQGIVIYQFLKSKNIFSS